MPQMNHYVAFTLDEQSYCLDLSGVARVVHAADIAALPRAPQIVMGILNLNGEIIPVVNIRKRFRLPEKEIALSDELIIARTAKRTVAILAESVTRVIESQAERIVAPEEVLPNTDYVAGIIKLPDGMVLIHDLDTFLSLEEEKSLDSAIDGARSKE